MELVAEAELRRSSLAHEARDVVRLDAFDASTGWAVSLQLSIFGNQQAVMIGALLRPDQAAIGLVADEVAAPARLWEIRGSGIWAEHVCESPLDHWSYGLEAFALAVDEPTEIVETGLGHRVPLGWELEFEADFPAVATNAPMTEASGGFQQDGRVHGIILDADGEHPFDGVGVRSRWWGTLSPTAIDVAAPMAAIRSAIDLPDGTAAGESTDGGLWRLDLSATGLAARRMPWG